MPLSVMVNSRIWGSWRLAWVLSTVTVRLEPLVGSASDARHKGELAVQLQFALDSRVLLEQAKGILMERHSLDEQVAFTRLRRMARSSSRKLTEVAREIILNR